ncbi:MAG: hypothetical protein R3A80_09615 [Bdellovibrionota bacterium]
MDKQVIPDLSEPTKRAPATRSGTISRKWHFALSLYAAAMAYAFLHKAILPFVLGYLGTSRSEYSTVSYGVIWVLILGYTLHKEQEVSQRVQLFMGTALGFATFELLLIFLDTQKGWLLFSHILAAVPLIVSILYLLKFTNEKKWGIIASGFVVYLLTEGVLWKLPQ